MRGIVVASVLVMVGASVASADGCGGAAQNYEGVWLNESGVPTAEFVVSVDAFQVGQTGCYWIEATPEWGITTDVQHALRVVDTDLQGGILMAVALDEAAIDAGENAWVWVTKAGLTSSGFTEMYFNRQTLGVPR
ncbi:MAG: hypothetical protein AAGL89_14695 [Pseudomonadota bacterium]